MRDVSEALTYFSRRSDLGMTISYAIAWPAVGMIIENALGSADPSQASAMPREASALA